MLEDREAANSRGWSPEDPVSDEDHEYILWMANHIERELDDAFYDRNVNGDDSYLKELDERYKAGFSTRIRISPGESSRRLAAVEISAASALSPPTIVCF